MGNVQAVIDLSEELYLSLSVSGLTKGISPIFPTCPTAQHLGKLLKKRFQRP
jgi:hypothetical protein